MSSSPCPAILVEAQEPPLNLRRQYLASKFLIKIRGLNENELIRRVCTLTSDCLTNSFCSLKNNPPLVDAFLETNQYNAYLNTTSKFPIFSNDFDTIMFKPTLIFPKYGDHHIENRNIINSILSSHRNEIVIYTHGSKNESATGSAVYISNTNQAFSYRILDQSSIFTAELFALDCALDIILKSNMGNSIILSDSQAALRSLSWNPKQFNNHIIYNIKHKLSSLYKKGVVVSFIWAKGHSGIDGNERADQLAKEALKKTEINRIILNSDINNLFKANIRENWQKLWAEYVRSSKTHYALIHTSLPKTIPYIFDYHVPKYISTSITRLKLNHGNFPSHLHKLGLVESPLCSCDHNSVGDLNHIFFACGNHRQATENLIS